ncbi:MAG: HNH endonuclease [Candidatus Hadarchaeota archaeon]
MANSTDEITKILLGAPQENRKNRKPVRKAIEREVLARAGHKCQSCKRPLGAVWNIHHKDGNRNNDRLSNLKVLCPTCHAEIHHKIRVSARKIRKSATQMGVLSGTPSSFSKPTSSPFTFGSPRGQVKSPFDLGYRRKKRKRVSIFGE